MQSVLISIRIAGRPILHLQGAIIAACGEQEADQHCAERLPDLVRNAVHGGNNDLDQLVVLPLGILHALDCDKVFQHTDR